LASVNGSLRINMVTSFGLDVGVNAL